MMNELENQQILQESKYEYPYHYIPMWDGNTFSQTHTLAMGYEYLSYLHFLLDKVSQIGFDSLLDVGCGDGRFLFELGRRFSNKKLAGVDYSKRAIDYARIIAPNVEWFCEDIRNENIFGIKFDIITLIETLEHIPPGEISTFLKGIHHYLGERGTFIVTVPSNNIEVSEVHYQHFDLNSLVNTLSPFFTVADVKYLNRKPTLSFRLIRKILHNPLFILNNKIMLKSIYKYYLHRFLIANIKSCRRIAVVCKKNA
jgi:SAM-dependent methyltransferase